MKNARTFPPPTSGLVNAYNDHLLLIYIPNLHCSNASLSFIGYCSYFIIIYSSSRYRQLLTCSPGELIGSCTKHTMAYS